MVVAALCVAGIGGRAAEAGVAPEKIVFCTDWYPQPEQGGFFQAAATGLYERKGLNVDIVAGAPRMPIITMVAQNRMQLGTSNSNDIITAISEGYPLVMIMAYLQRSPSGIMFDPAHPIHSFSELNGRTVMAQPASAWVRFVEKKYKIQINVVPTTWGVGRFLADPTGTFLQMAYATSEPYFVEQAGRKAEVLLTFDAGFRPYRIVYSNRDFVAAHTWEVRAFLDASMAGWKEYLHGDHSPGDRMIKERNRQVNDSIIKYGRDAMLRYHLAEGLPSAGEALGKLDVARLEETVATLRDLDVIRQSPAIKDYIFQ